MLSSLICESRFSLSLRLISEVLCSFKAVHSSVSVKLSNQIDLIGSNVLSGVPGAKLAWCFVVLGVHILIRFSIHVYQNIVMI